MLQRHAFEEWFRRHKGDMSRAEALAVWNTLVNTAAEEVAIAKDRFVFEENYEAAQVAAHIQQLVTALEFAERGPKAK